MPGFAKGRPFAAERDESLVSAKRAPPEEDSLEAASEREDDSTEAAALSLVNKPFPVLARTGIAVTFDSVDVPTAFGFTEPPLIVTSRDVAPTVRGIVLDEAMIATGPDTLP